MKLSTITSAIGAGATLLKTASTLSVVVGAIYLADCRIHSGNLDQCYITALPIMGLGAAGHGGYALGFNTLNPALRPQEGERDEHGRFKKRQPPVES